MKSHNPKFSETIAEFCNAVSNAQKDYDWNYEEVNRLDELTQDYLHQLELKDLDYAGRAKIATQLSRCRRERRNSKDTVEILEPLIEFLDSDKGQQMMKLMREVLGQTRLAEKRMGGRVYKHRVLTDEGDIIERSK